MIKLICSSKFILRRFSLIAVFILTSSTAFALPLDGKIRSGDVQLNQINSKRLDVNQSSDKAIIDWHSFNIAHDEHTHFQLPSSDALSLNRVTGGQRSDIFGKLSSNGRLMLINPNGVVFGQNSQVDVHGLVATTNDIRNEDFLANRFHFTLPGNPSARIVNRGTINIANAGLLAFVAPGVENSGIINARLGRVGLASSNQFTLDLYGDNLITLGVEGKVLDKVYDENGKPVSSLIDQSGTINADGGRVYLQTNAAKNIVDHAINVSGIIEAKTAEKKRGDIILNGGGENRVKLTGVLNASGLENGQTGGTVHVLGDEVILEKAKIFASGFNGGGIVLVGGDYQGKGSVLNARNTYFDVNSYIYADATNSGNGGKIILWADERTDSFGKIYARGGVFGGDGGFVETSGKQVLAVTQAADVSAPFGKPGQWLLDPFDIEIVDSLDNAALTGGNKVDVAIINAALNNGTSVKIQSNNNGAGEGNILLSSAISKTSGGNATLTLDAAGGITINETITATTGALTLELMAATGVVINKALTLNGGSVTLNSNETFSRTNFENPGRQNIVQISHLCGAARPAEVHVSGVPSGLVHLSGNQNTENASAGHGTGITLAGSSITTSGGNATFQDGVTLSTSSVGVTTSGGNITFNGTLDGAQDLSLSASTGIINFNEVVGGTTGFSNFTVGSSSVTIFNADSNFSSGLSIVNATDGISILGNMTNTIDSCCLTIFFNADSDSDGSGTISLASGKTFTSDSVTNFLGADFDIQGNINTSSNFQFRRVAAGSFGIGDASGDATISGYELDRITAKSLDFRMDASVYEFNIDNVQAFQTDNISGSVRIFGSQDNSTSSINFINNPSYFGGNVLRLGTTKKINTINFNTDVTTDGAFSAFGSTINFTGNSTLTAKNLGGVTLTNQSLNGGGSLIMDGTDLNMSSNSVIDAVSGSISLEFSDGITLGLLKTNSISNSSAIRLTAGSGGIRDADIDGSLDIFAPNGTLVVNASGGFGTFSNPIEFNVGSLDIPSDQDFSSTSVIANQIFSTTFNQSLEIVSTNRTFRASSEFTSTVTFFSTNVGNSPTQAIGNFSPTISPIFTNVFSQSFSLIDTTTSTNTTFESSSFSSFNSESGEEEGSFADRIVLASLNNSSLGRGLFDNININSSVTSSLNFGLQSLSQTVTASQFFSSSIATTSFQPFGLGTRSLGSSNVQTIGNGIATGLITPSGTMRAANIMVGSDGSVNSQNTFDDVGMDFTPSNRNTGFSTNIPVSSEGSTPGDNIASPAPSTGQGISRDEPSNLNANISGSGTSIPIGRPVGPSSSGSVSRDEAPSVNANISSSETSVGARISGSETPSVTANISGGQTSVNARISGGETLSINANISGSETSVGARISGSSTAIGNTVNPANNSNNLNPDTNPITPSSENTTARISGNSTSNIATTNNQLTIGTRAETQSPSLTSRISGSETPSNQNLDDRMTEIRNRIVGRNTNQTSSNSNSNSGSSEQPLEQRMRSLYDRLVGSNQTSSETSDENSENEL